MPNLARYSKLIVAITGVAAQAAQFYAHGHEWGQLVTAVLAAVLVGLVPNVPPGVGP